MTERTIAPAVCVTTVHRGVFFGYLQGSVQKERVTLLRARACLSWTEEMHGVWGLCVKGPGEGCRIGPAVPELVLIDITAVATVTDEAAARWEAEPWKP